MAQEEIPRGLLVLQLLGYSNWDLPDKEVREILGREDLAPELRVPLESVLARHEFRQAQWLAELRRREEEERLRSEREVR